MKQFLPYAWAVETANDFKALILDRTRATQYAADSHGILVPLYDLRELEPKTVIEEPRDET
jgi:hypothetical protein